MQIFPWRSGDIPRLEEGCPEQSAGTLASRYSNAQLLTMVEAVEDITSALALHANKNLTLSRLVSRLAAGM